MAYTWYLSTLFYCFLGLCAATVQERAHSQLPACSGPVDISMASGSFSPQPGVTFQLKHFKAVLTPMGKTSPVCYGHFTDVAHAEVFASNATVTELFGEKLAAADSNITGLKIVHGADGVTISGKLKKALPLFFSISGPVSTNGSEIRMDAKTIKADGVPVKSLMAMIGENLNAMLQLKRVKGITVRDDSLSFSPEQVAHLRGHIASVSTSPEGLTIRYSDPPPHRKTPARKRL